ncbi:hypothetical protein Tco_1160282 [Tanacetum coccineum]
MNSGNNHADMSSLSNILHTSVMIHSNIIVRRDGTVQSFCGLKLSDIGIPITGTSPMPAKRDTRKAIVETLDRPFPQAGPRRTCGSHLLTRGDGCPMTACHVAAALTRTRFQVAGRMGNQRVPRVHGDKKWQLSDV